MTKYKALMTIVTTLIGQASPGYANPEKSSLETIIQAIAVASSEDWEAETLTRIAWWESGFRKEYINCTIVGKHRDSGAFQVIPRNHSEALLACSSNHEEQVKLALSRIRESRKLCESNGFRGSDVLSGYTIGKCTRGDSLSRVRFGDGTLVRSLMNKHE
jgi:hypothetical protein